MFLVQLIYASKVSEGFGPNDINNILNTAYKNNTENGVTGLLCFDHSYFLQCLEGSRTAVNNTYQKIMSDRRHNSCIILHYSSIVQREFADWGMGYIGLTDANKNILFNYDTAKEFNPFGLSEQSAQRLLIELGRTLREEKSNKKIAV